MTKEEIDIAFAATLAADYDDDAPWNAVEELRLHGDRYIFGQASEWCGSPDRIKRARGADILCQLRAPLPPEQRGELKFYEAIFVSESFEIVSAMIQQEADEQALSSELHALGHLRQEGSVSLILPYASSNSAEIRYAVTHALGSFPQDPDAVRALMMLADDPDEEIRDWSLFALGSQSDADSTELRELFVRHLEDTCSDAREEALAGLAKRQDARAVLPLLHLMESGSYYSHHMYDFIALVGEDPELDDWGTDDFIDALYARFPDQLPPRKPQRIAHSEK